MRLRHLLRSWPAIVSVLLHGTAVAALVLRFEEEEPKGAKSAGTGGIEVALGPLGGAAGSLAPTMPAVTEAAVVRPAETRPTTEQVRSLTPEPPVEEARTRREPDPATPVREVATTTPRTVEPAEARPVRPVEARPARPLEAEARPVPPAEALPIEPVPTVTEAEPLPVVRAREPDATTPVREVVQLAETRPREVAQVQARREPTPVREVAQARPAQPETVQAQDPARPPPPRPRPRPQVVEPQPQQAQAPVEQPSAAPAAPITQAAAASPAVQGAAGRAGARGGRDSSSEDSQAAGGLPGAPGDYLALLQAWLAKHKEYPRQAQMRRQEGTVLLQFVMNREGRVLSFRVARSSGYPMLDSEVEAMIRRAEPLPSMPDDMPQERLEFVVPVRFQLK